MLDAKIVQRFKLNGTIDGHDPIGVTWRIKGDNGFFRVTFITVNWGRGYRPGEFHRNVMNVLNTVGEREYVVLLIQELDEADAAPERKIFVAEMEKGTTLVPSVKSHKAYRETLAISPGVKVTGQRQVVTMEAGLKIGANPGTGPTRFFVSCYITVEGVRIFVGDQHPHRVDPNSSPRNKFRVEQARRRGVGVTRAEVKRGMKTADMAVYGGDMNDSAYPAVHPDERVAYEVGLDTLKVGIGVMRFDLVKYVETQVEWSTDTFGPGVRKGVVDHIKKELVEIEEADYTDLEEWIDVIILGLDGAWRSGHTPREIAAMLVSKAEKNHGRKWPDWKLVGQDLAIEHVRE